MWKIISLILICFICNSYGKEFRDDAFNLNVTIDENVWELVPSEKYRDRFLLKHASLPATINIIAYRFNETITANGLVQRRIQSVYDGWQLIKMEELTEIQSKKKNIDEGFRSIYRKIYLDENLNEQQQYAGDICLVTDDTLAIVLNITMDHASTLLRVKDDFNQIYSSFWHGTEKPIVNIVVTKEDQWIKDQQNLARRRFYESNFIIKDDSNLMNQLPIKKDNDFKNAKLYNNENGQYILSNRTLYIVNGYKNEIKTINLDLNNPQLQLTADGFYAIQLKPYLKIKKFNLDLQVLDTIEDRPTAIDAFALNDHFIVVNSNELKLMSKSNSIWSFEYQFNQIEMVANLEQLIIADKNKNKLLFFDLNKGELKAQVDINQISSNLEGRIIDVVLNQGKLLITMMNGNNIIKSVINTDTKQEEDQLIIENVSEFKLIGVSNNLIIVQYRTRFGEGFLEALDFNTFASAWKRPFSNIEQSIVSKHGVLFFNHKDQDLISLELASAANTSTLNITKLISPPRHPSDNQIESKIDKANLIKVMPLKSKLMALIRVKNKPRIVFIR